MKYSGSLSNQRRRLWQNETKVRLRHFYKKVLFTVGNGDSSCCMSYLCDNGDIRSEVCGSFIRPQFDNAPTRCHTTYLVVFPIDNPPKSTDKRLEIEIQFNLNFASNSTGMGFFTLSQTRPQIISTAQAYCDCDPIQ